MIWDSDKYIGIKGWGVTIICYAKKCIGDYYCHIINTCVPVVRHCHNVFSTFPAWIKGMFLLHGHLKSISQASTLYKDIKSGYQYYWSKTFEYHMHSLIYLFPVIDAVSMIAIEFQLDYVKVVSLLQAFAAMPHIIFYFIPTLILLCYNIENHCKVLTSNRGPLLDFRIYKLMFVHYSRDPRTMNSKSKWYPVHFKLKISAIKKETWMEDI